MATDVNLLVSIRWVLVVDLDRCTVCPVFATYHNEEGLNAQIYNRCIGTRFCGSACPYKVRTYNWFQPEFPEPLTEQLNPDVSVRTRGIMEKSTFCPNWAPIRE